MAGQNIPGVYLRTDTGAKIQVILRNGDGMERLLPPATPAEDLVLAVSMDYSDYRRCQRQFEIVRKRRRNFVVFRRGGVIKIKCCLAQKEC